MFSCGTGTYAVRVLVAVLPAWWRFAQCLRRYYDTKEANPHLINAGKYSTSFFVVVFSAVASTVIGETTSCVRMCVCVTFTFQFCPFSG